MSRGQPRLPRRCTRLARRARPIVAFGLGLVAATIAAAPGRADANADGRAAGGVRGRIVDADTGAPVVDALVFEAETSGRGAADVRRFRAVHRTTTDASGTFAFPPRRRPRFAFLRPARPLRYLAYHPDYGLVRMRAPETDAIPVRVGLRDAHLRQAEARALCGSTSTDAFHATLRARVCPPARPELHPNGRPRARGAVDARGRRTGRWLFLRADGSIRAIGAYAEGGAIGAWRFLPRTAADGPAPESPPPKDAPGSPP